MFTFGFHNSLNGDREYDAVQLSQIFDGVIADGVFATYGESLIPLASSPEDMNVNIGVGRAWFMHTWSYNSTILPVAIPAAELVLDRIDTIVLEIDNNVEFRANAIKVIEGVAGASPVPPTLIDTELKKQIPLCDVYVGAGVTTILQANITNRVGTVDCPFVTGLIDTIDTSALLVQWEDEFRIWFDTIKDILDESTAGNLLLLITKNYEMITGAVSTSSGDDDWNDISNLQPGISEHLQSGNTLNGPQEGDGTLRYFHVWNVEFGAAQDGTGNIRQRAMPYNASSDTTEYTRTRYSGVWTDWKPSGAGALFNIGSIPTTGWSVSTSDYALEQWITIPGLLSTDWIDVVIDKNYHDVAGDAEICPTVEEGINAFLAFCNTAPIEVIPFKWKVVR